MLCVGVYTPANKNYYSNPTGVMDQPDEWVLGLELYGTSNQSVGESYFTHNSYMSATN
jgi:hypothetical protein